jgi:hypothetical protein
MNKSLITSYSYGSRKAEIHQVTENHFRLELYDGGALCNQLTLMNLVEAKKMAETYTDGPSGSKTLLTE